MKMGAERIYEIVLTLRNFSRLDEAQMKSVNIHEGIDSSLLILRDRLKEKPEHPAISIIKEYGNLPLAECYAGQLNQVFMNILSNAIDSLRQPDPADSAKVIKPYTPTITIHTKVKNSNWVEISIQDNGRGMTESVLARLFDPFFTTKEVGKGTGLGLSISYQIVVEKHGGKLQCISAPGQGAKFIIEIPIRQNSKP
jgi:signal transduction histidine kinase